jgi:AraC-like DNA-binding protein
VTEYTQKINELTDINFRNVHQTERAISAKKFIDLNFDKPISLGIIANAIHCSKFHLNREFKRLYGFTPAKYLREKRIQEAKKILTNYGTVADACFNVGYESFSTFSLLFRRMTGKNAKHFKTARMKK